ncbi:MAG: hypothetical protein J5J00_01010 [Deltaproteobacteria bacterium]|nr:hypothetical protein [Deltaproteobacteria bacterium]
MLVKHCMAALPLLFLGACAADYGNVYERNRASSIAYQDIHFKPRIDEVLGTGLDNAEARRGAIAAQGEEQVTPGRGEMDQTARASYRPYAYSESGAEREGIPHPSLGRIRIGEPIQVEGVVRAAATSSSSGDVAEVVVSDGKDQFEVVSPAVRRQLAAALGRRVLIDGKVAGVRGAAVAIDAEKIRFLD